MASNPNNPSSPGCGIFIIIAAVAGLFGYFTTISNDPEETSLPVIHQEMVQQERETQKQPELPIPFVPQTTTIDEIEKQIKPAHEIWREYEKIRNERK